MPSNSSSQPSPSTTTGHGQIWSKPRRNGVEASRRNDRRRCRPATNWSTPPLEVRLAFWNDVFFFGKQQELPTRDMIREMIEWFIGDVVDELGSRQEIEYAYRILSEGSSADRQLATYQRTGDLKDVVDQLILETAEGVV